MKCLRNEVKIRSYQTNIREICVEIINREGFNKKTVFDKF